MSAKQLYTVVIWLRDKKEPKNDKVVYNEQTEATSADNAKIVAIRALTADQAADLDALEVQVRNF